MPVNDSHGEAMGRRLNADAASFVTRALSRSTVAVTELKYRDPQFILSTPPAAEDAYLVAVHLELFERYEYWEDGKPARPSMLMPGETIVYDVARAPTFHLNSAFHSVHFYFPRGALDAIADEAGATRFGELHYVPGAPRADPILRGMAEALLPLFGESGKVSRLFMDHALLAAGHHVAVAYGGMSPIGQPLTGGLTPTQERRAKELLVANLAGDFPLAALAKECGLSASQFSRAFRRSVGMPPHRWMIRQRVERAKACLRDSRAPLAEIALARGFSDQSHFTRCFAAWTGVSPGAWRRAVRD